jgi:capsular polysaccharide biosynthesis protein
MQNELTELYPPLIGHWDDVIMVMTDGQNYAHWHIDKIPAILALGKKLIARSMFVAFEPQQFVMESLTWLGFKPEQIIWLGGCERIACTRLWTIDPYPFYVICPPMLVRWRQLIVQKADLDKSRPTRFGFQNRDRNRMIANLTETVEEIQSRVPRFNWEILPIQWPGIIEAAREMNTLRFFFAPHGAGLANVMYMQQMTVFVDIQKTVNGAYFFYMAPIFKIRCVYTNAVDNLGGGYWLIWLPLRLSLRLIEAALTLIHEDFEV